MTTRLPEQRARKDAVRNRAALLEAAGQILRERPEEASMAAVASCAGLSQATAYRYFSSIEDLLNAYLHQVVIRLRDFSHDCPATGPALFDEVAAEWFRLLDTYGTAMVQLRSREGLLKRLHRNDPVIGAVREAWERPVRALMRAEDVPDSEFDAALFLYNTLFDPREVLDLTAVFGDPDAVRRRLTATYRAALKGWSATPASS